MSTLRLPRSIISQSKTNYRHLVIVIVLLFSSFLLAACGATDVKHTSGERHQITIDFIKMMDEDPQLRHLMEESLMGEPYATVTVE